MEDVALVSMPFSLPDRPSLGLSLLKSSLGLRGISSRVLYPALWLASSIKDPLAVWRIAQNARDALAGEWVFAEAVFGEDPQLDKAFIDYLMESSHSPLLANPASQMAEDVRLLRSGVSDFLDTCMTVVNWGACRVVGFTTTFHQTLPSVALATRIKERYPHVVIAFGGANCEGDMGVQLLRSFPCIDLVCIGEGDNAFPEAVSRILEGTAVGDIQGIIHRDALIGDDNTRVDIRPDVVSDLNRLPYPDFDDFFEAYKASGFSARVALPFETSRGCWWGAKNPCRFCGVNGSKSAYRSKVPDRALAEIRHLVDSYGSYQPVFQASDSILDYHYLDTLLPNLCGLNLTRDMFYEVKANLTEDQVRSLAEAGVTSVQAGIESLSSSILRLMNKGVSMLQCVQLLKWSQQYGVMVSWNVIVAFPGELETEYTAMANLIPNLTHLMPPINVVPVRFDRFSAYFKAPNSYGIRRLVPKESYFHVFRGIRKEDINQIAYYFDGEYDQAQSWPEYTAPLFNAIRNWVGEYKTAKLYSFAVDDNTLYVQDTRRAAGSAHYLFRGVDRLVLQATHRIRSESHVTQYVEEHMGSSISPEEIRASLGRLTVDKLIISEGGRYLSVVVPLMEKDLTDSAREYVDQVRRLVCSTTA